MKKRPLTTANLEEHFGELDRFKLDEEWVKQDRLVGYYGNQLALAKRKLEEAKTACSVFEAETARRVRQKPKNYNVQRMTESAVKEAVGVLLLTSTVHDKWAGAKFKVDLLESAMRRLEHRKRALTDLIYLQGQTVAQPIMPKDQKARDRINRKKEDRFSKSYED